MVSNEPLHEFGNQRQPRRKLANTYGKKKGLQATSQQAHQAVFGQDESDLGDHLAKLDLKDKDERLASAALARNAKTSSASEEVEKQVSQQRSSTKSLPDSPSSISNQHTGSSLEPLLVLSAGTTTDIEKFTTFGTKLSKLFKIEKIGEGSFAEVFKITSHHPGSSLSLSSSSSSSSKPSGSRSRPNSSKTSTTTTTNVNQSDSTGTEAGGVVSSSSRYTSIIKVIPLDYNVDNLETRERCSTAKSVAHEVNILKQLDPIHGFTRFRGVRLVSGLWPASFLSAFREFRKRHRKRAINAPPDHDFGPDQIYALVEMDDAGTEISLIKRPSVFQVWDIFWISTILLANAEESINFEHRDLHMSNICVKAASDLLNLSRPAVNEDVDEVESRAQAKSSSKTSTSTTAAASSSIPDIDQILLESIYEIPSERIGMSTLRVTIIDYTVARARLPAYNHTSRSSMKRHNELDFKKSPRGRSKQVIVETDNQKGTDDYDDYDDDDDTIMFDPLKFTSDPLPSDPNDHESRLQNQTYKKTRAIALLNASLDHHHHHHHRNHDPRQDLLLQKSPSKKSRPLTSSSTYETSSDDDDDDDGDDNDNKWRAFLPRTNVVWLGYLLRILIHRARSKTGKLNILKGKTGKKTGNGNNNKIVKDLQEQMWDVLVDVSKVLNGSDFREIEEQEPKPKPKPKPKLDHVDEEESEEKEKQRQQQQQQQIEDPTWTNEELEQLPFSALEVLETAVTSGWLSIQEIQRFRNILEEEEEDGEGS